MVEPNMVDMRLDSCFLLAENFPDALDWPSFPREGRRPDFLLLARLRQRCFWLAIRSGTLQRVCVPSCNSSTWSGSSNKQQKKQAAAASSYCKTSPADAHAGMAPCRRLTQTDLSSCSRLLCISRTIIRPAVQSQLHGNGQGSTVTRRRSGEGQERGGVLCTNPARAAAAAASVAASKRCCKSKHNAFLQASTACCCMVLLLHAHVPSAPRV